MKRRKREDGFVMLEVMAILMIVLLLVSTLYGIAGMRYRRALAKIQEEEAYYTAIAAVRMMAKEVVEEDADERSISCMLTKGSGISTISPSISDSNSMKVFFFLIPLPFVSMQEMLPSSASSSTTSLAIILTAAMAV